MLILVVSDSHGKKERVVKAIEENRNNIEKVFFLGDGLREIKEIEGIYEGLEFDYVRGNNDFYYVDEPEDKKILIGGKKILLTHGHKYTEPREVEKLLERCKREKIQAVLWGHTHRKKEEYMEGILFLNPGSISLPFDGTPSYSIVEIGDKISNEFRKI